MRALRSSDEEPVEYTYKEAGKLFGWDVEKLVISWIFTLIIIFLSFSPAKKPSLLLIFFLPPRLCQAGVNCMPLRESGVFSNVFFSIAHVSLR